jgi:hypothetical protein
MSTKKNDQSPRLESKPDLIKLTEHELLHVTGGRGHFIKIDGIKGESQDDKHKDM